MSQKGQVKSHTRKTKGGKTITVKAHTRKTKGGASKAKGAGKAYAKRISKFPPLEVRNSPKSKFTRERKAVTKKDKETEKNIRQRGYISPRDNY